MDVFKSSVYSSTFSMIFFSLGAGRPGTILSTRELQNEVKQEKEKVEKKNDKTLLPKKRESSKKGLGVS
mgnify:CR=1 FL=1